MRKVIELGKIPYSGKRAVNLATPEIELRVKTPDVAPYLDIDLMPYQVRRVLSICGSIWKASRSDIYAGGQILPELAGYFPRLKPLVPIWRAFHLNGLQAGTREQMNALGDVRDYDKACELLKVKGLYSVPIPEGSRENFRYKVDKQGNLPTHYTYGSAWLYEAIPDQIITRIEEIVGVSLNA